MSAQRTTRPSSGKQPEPLSGASKMQNGVELLRKDTENPFDWGMLTGKLSAIRWVLGSGWDFLDS